MESIKSKLPGYAKDIKLNLGIIDSSTELTPAQAWGTALATAFASRNPELLAAVTEAASAHLDAAGLDGARGAAAIMGMNNVYYRYLHLSGNTEVAGMPARLRMHIIGNPGVPKLDFELWCLAVSAINGCGQCITSHEHVVKEQGASTGAVHDVVRIASVIHAAAVILDAQAGAGALQAAA